MNTFIENDHFDDEYVEEEYTEDDIYSQASTADEDPDISELSEWIYNHHYNDCYYYRFIPERYIDDIDNDRHVLDYILYSLQQRLPASDFLRINGNYIEIIHNRKLFSISFNEGQRGIAWRIVFIE